MHTTVESDPWEALLGVIRAEGSALSAAGILRGTGMQGDKTPLMIRLLDLTASQLEKSEGTQCQEIPQSPLTLESRKEPSVCVEREAGFTNEPHSDSSLRSG